jgi:hypothetical protein
MCLFNFAIDANIVSKTLLMGATNWINIFFVTRSNAQALASFI